jgi:hypothetical protein
MQSATLSVTHLNSQFTGAHQLVAGISRGACATLTPAKQPCIVCAQPKTSSRRQLLGAAVLSAAVIGCWSQPPPAAASLVQFPCDALNNKYVLVRAGESYSEADNVVLTNPAWKTSMAAGLSERGKAQVCVLRGVGGVTLVVLCSLGCA